MPRRRKRFHGEKDNPFGLAIPIAVLLIIMVLTRIVWLLIPLVVLLIVFASSVRKEQEISRRASDIDYWKAPDVNSPFSGSHMGKTPRDREPIYETQRKQEQGITAGALIPIAVLVILFFLTNIIWFIVPIAVLVIFLFSASAKSQQNQSHVIKELETGDAKSIDDAASETGLPEEKVRRHVVESKRKGKTNVWFDPETGRKISTSLRVTEPQTEKVRACEYCGFKLKEDDRFCPYCGAPIKAE
ncbi:MAG: zinc ribbon domain-containing protein [Promethearchaeia archaeon]